MKVLFLCTTLLLSPLLSNSQTRIQEIDTLVSFCQRNGMFNGNILVAEKGEIIYQRSLGLADPGTGRALNANTSFCLGSISKQFTAFGIMLLQEQGKLRVSDTLGEVFPEMPQYLHPITLEQLMQHSSGLKRTHYEEHDGLTNREIFENLMNSQGDQLLFEPGTDFSYSNSGYMLLAMVIERISGQSFAHFLHDQVWMPLGMTHTFVMSPKNRKLENLAIGYDGFGRKEDFNVFTYGSNGIYSSTEDLYRWAQSFTADKLIPLSIKAKAWQPAVAKSGRRLVDYTGTIAHYYGYGLYVFKDDLEGVIGHSGAFGGFFTAMTKDIENDREVIILTNNGRLIPIVNVVRAVHHILEEEPYTLPQISIDYELRKHYYDDIDGAINYYQKLKKNKPADYKFDNEWELNRLGYALMADQRLPDAIKILKLLISEFPDRPNPHDSLGEAYYQNGQYEKSIKSYERALEIDKNYNVDWIQEMLAKNRAKLSRQKRNR